MKITQICFLIGHNDIPLLSACHIKVAMGNADPRLKQIADYTTEPLEKHGFSLAIEKFIFDTKLT